MAKVAIGKGHCFRDHGATGTDGEQGFADKMGVLIAARLKLRGHTATIFLADDKLPVGFDAAIHLHADGSESPQAHGASVGYPAADVFGNAASDAGKALGSAWKTAYQAHGWSRGFRPDNYTTGLSQYYGHKKALKAGIPRSLVVEHGFFTNSTDRAWMLANFEHIAQTHVDAIETVLGTSADEGPAPPPGTYVVRTGDTLFGIAQRLKFIGGWQALYAKNRVLIGPDPAKLRVGQELRVG